MRSSVIARPEAAHGNFARSSTCAPSFCASVSVRPAHASSGSVNTTAGIAAGSKHDVLAQRSPRPRRGPRATPCARASARPPRRRSRRSSARRCGDCASDLDEAALRRPSRLRPGRGTAIELRPPARSRRAPCRTPRSRCAEALILEGHGDAVLRSLHRRRPWYCSSTASHIFSMRLARIATRSRSAPGSRPGVISTTVTFAAERRVDAAELEADVAAADHEQRLRDVRQVERAGRVHHARAVDARPRHLRRAAEPVGDDRVVEGHAARCRPPPSPHRATSGRDRRATRGGR